MRHALFLVLAACGSAPAAPPTDPQVVTATPAPVVSKPAPACTGLAVVFVIDRSGSMAGQPLEMAKDATLEGAKLLGAGDCVEVVAFDGAAERTFAMHAPDAVFERDVRAIQPGGGTAIGSALDRAHTDLASVASAKKKHVLVLTDGQSPREGLAALADAIAKDGGTLSAIALGDSADETTLNDLATRGHGSFFKAKSPSALSGLFEKDIRAALK